VAEYAIAQTPNTNPASVSVNNFFIYNLPGKFVLFEFRESYWASGHVSLPPDSFHSLLPFSGDGFQRFTSLPASPSLRQKKTCCADAQIL
jgi:hypothetical protein